MVSTIETERPLSIVLTSVRNIQIGPGSRSGALLLKQVTGLSQTRVTLGIGKIDPQWTLDFPIFLVVEREDDGWYVISDEVFEVYGDGATFKAALDEYVDALLDQRSFYEEEAKTNPLALPQWQRFEKYVRRLAP